MRTTIWLLLFIIVASASAVTGKQRQTNIRLRCGDLLFCNSTQSELSKAIDHATQTKQQTHFDHLGIVDLKNDTLWVLHAAPTKGVSRETIQRFIHSDKETTITVYRLTSKYQNTIPTAIQRAYKYLGAPYNQTYRMADEGYYCSEYIYEIFAPDSIFSLHPMTFKNLQINQFLPGWIDYYKKLGILIPEGEPGCNPNGMAASDKLKRIGILKVKPRCN